MGRFTEISASWIARAEITGAMWGFAPTGELVQVAGTGNQRSPTSPWARSDHNCKPSKGVLVMPRSASSAPRSASLALWRRPLLGRPVDVVSTRLGTRPGILPRQCTQVIPHRPRRPHLVAGPPAGESERHGPHREDPSDAKSRRKCQRRERAGRRDAEAFARAASRIDQDRASIPRGGRKTNSGSCVGWDKRGSAASARYSYSVSTAAETPTH